MSQFLELHADKLLRGNGNGNGKGNNVLELGAGGGLPGLVAALEGAGQVGSLHYPLSQSFGLCDTHCGIPECQVVISDFPDASLVNNLAKNVEMNIGKLNGTEGIAQTSAIVCHASLRNLFRFVI